MPILFFRQIKSTRSISNAPGCVKIGRLTRSESRARTLRLPGLEPGRSTAELISESKATTSNPIDQKPLPVTRAGLEHCVHPVQEPGALPLSYLVIAPKAGLEHCVHPDEEPGALPLSYFGISEEFTVW